MMIYVVIYTYVRAYYVPQGSSLSLTALFRTPNVRKRSLILFSSWFVTGLTYYGLSLNSANDLSLGESSSSDGNSSSSTYLTFTFYGLIEIPAIALSIVSIITAGRRLTLTLLLVGVGISCVGAGVIPQGMFPGIHSKQIVYKTYWQTVKCFAAQ